MASTSTSAFFDEQSALLYKLKRKLAHIALSRRVIPVAEDAPINDHFWILLPESQEIVERLSYWKLNPLEDFYINIYLAEETDRLPRRLTLMERWKIDSKITTTRHLHDLKIMSTLRPLYLLTRMMPLYHLYRLRLQNHTIPISFSYEFTISEMGHGNENKRLDRNEGDEKEEMRMWSFGEDIPTVTKKVVVSNLVTIQVQYRYQFKLMTPLSLRFPEIKDYRGDERVRERLSNHQSQRSNQEKQSQWIEGERLIQMSSEKSQSNHVEGELQSMESDPNYCSLQKEKFNPFIKSSTLDRKNAWPIDLKKEIQKEDSNQRQDDSQNRVKISQYELDGEKFNFLLPSFGQSQTLGSPSQSPQAFNSQPYHDQLPSNIMLSTTKHESSSSEANEPIYPWFDSIENTHHPSLSSCQKFQSLPTLYHHASGLYHHPSLSSSPPSPSPPPISPSLTIPNNPFCQLNSSTHPDNRLSSSSLKQGENDAILSVYELLDRNGIPCSRSMPNYPQYPIWINESRRKRQENRDALPVAVDLSSSNKAHFSKRHYHFSVPSRYNHQSKSPSESPMQDSEIWHDSFLNDETPILVGLKPSRMISLLQRYQEFNHWYYRNLQLKSNASSNTIQGMSFR